MNIELRDFTKTDYYAFAGAVRFPDMEAPMMATITSGNDEQEQAVLVLSGCGIDCILPYPDLPEGCCLTMARDGLTKDMAIAATKAIAGMFASLNGQERILALNAFGFQNA